MKHALSIMIGLATLCISAAPSPPGTLSGIYKGEAFSMEFKNGKCFMIDATAPANKVEARFTIKGKLLYIAPIVPKGERMTNNVSIVYTIVDDRLESSHIEDMDSGQILNKDMRPKVILRKEQKDPGAADGKGKPTKPPGAEPPTPGQPPAAPESKPK